MLLDVECVQKSFDIFTFSYLCVIKSYSFLKFILLSIQNYQKHIGNTYCIEKPYHLPYMDCIKSPK